MVHPFHWYKFTNIYRTFALCSDLVGALERQDTVLTVEGSQSGSGDVTCVQGSRKERRQGKQVRNSAL